jgi:uncharacterized membrane protein YkoI
MNSAQHDHMTNNKFIKGSLLTLAATGVALLCYADNEIPLRKAPPAVQATVKKVIGKNKLVSLDSDVENGKRVYEVDGEAKKFSYSVHMSEGGDVLGISMDIPLTIVPDAVMEASKKAHPDGRITEPEIRSGEGEMYYKLEVMAGKQKHELLVYASGKIRSDETENESGGPDDEKKR